MLPDENDPEDDNYQWSDDSGNFSAESTEYADEDAVSTEDIAKDWREDVHDKVKSAIAELGGRVVPKLNWSAPKDALQMNANTMECTKADEIYTLLKSSAFVTHDLENAFDDCIDEGEPLSMSQISYHLILRKSVNFNPSVEFRCFVRGGQLLAICQRDPNYYEFLHKSQDQFRKAIQDFFDIRLRGTFADKNYVFDCYIPGSQYRTWLVDINPWAQRTDPLLFSWLELLEMENPPESETEEHLEPEAGFARLYFRKGPDGAPMGDAAKEMEGHTNDASYDDQHNEYDSDDESADEELYIPELRLVTLDDPVHRMNSQPYSAHKLPKEIVDASQGYGGIREALAMNDLAALKRAQQEQGEESDDSDD